jgi:hypothetical protein
MSWAIRLGLRIFIIRATIRPRLRHALSENWISWVRNTRFRRRRLRTSCASDGSIQLGLTTLISGRPRQGDRLRCNPLSRSRDWAPPSGRKAGIEIRIMRVLSLQWQAI